MNKESKKFLFDLLKTPSPSGFEVPLQKLVKRRMARFADSIESDLHGNLIVALNPKAKRRIMLAGHADQIGFMVKHISADGFIYIGAIGGIDVGVVEGARVTILGKKGEVRGVVGRKPIHLQKPEERKKSSVDLDKLWVDIGNKKKKETESLVTVGDPVTFELSVKELCQNRITSAGLDDKVGLFVAMEALRMCSRSKLNVGLYAVSTIQEEVGLRGATTAAYSVEPEVGIAIDVTHASDTPATAGHKAPRCILGKGPVISKGPNTNPVVGSLLEKVAKKQRIPYQLGPSPKLAGNDARAIQVSRSGVATATIGIPNRYMHTQVEICDLRDLQNSAKLLAEFVKSITARTSFKPV
ncbi:MAG: M42 family peptidase [Candidatus Dadabacteria bacterium]|nr:MAG: M42 family peptidase [Candidatus Dadabacteria bacterium]